MGVKRRKSRKQSSTSAHYQKQLKEVTFYLERSLGGKVIVEALRNAGLRIEPHFKWFRGDTADEEWLPEVGEKNWKVLMRDQRIGTRRLELEALLAGGVQAFVLVSGSLKNADNAAIIVKALPKIFSMLAQHDFPFIAKITRQSTVKLWKFQKPRRVKNRKRVRKK
ncbi:MAG: hypothetical protein ABR501_05145 [Pyrinomonadaceae bacterium]